MKSDDKERKAMRLEDWVHRIIWLIVLTVFVIISLCAEFVWQ